MKANVINDTNNFLKSITSKTVNTPTDLEFVFYVLAKEFGITTKDYKYYPVPYLNGLLYTFNHIKEMELEASKKKK